MTSLGDPELPDNTSDEDLILGAREGDTAATAALFRRHVGAARRFARSLTGEANSEDLVSEAFTRLFAALRNGNGPESAFRPYLLRVVRNLHASQLRGDQRLIWVDDPADTDLESAVQDDSAERHESEMLAKALRSLPERWQTVLWHTAVEGENHQAVGERLGLSANAVGALAFRAREGLRRAYLESHLAAAPDERCRSVREQLPAYVRGTVDVRRRRSVEAHLRSCAACTAGMLELGRINSQLGAALAPAVLGAAAERYLATVGSAVDSTATPRRWRRPARSAVVAAALVLLVAATAWGLVASWRSGGDEPIGAGPGASASPGGGGRAPEVGPGSSPAATPDEPEEPTSAADPGVAPAVGLVDPPTTPTTPDQPLPTSAPPSPDPTSPTEPPVEPPVEPGPADLIALTEGYDADFGAYRHVQMRPRSPYDATQLRLTVPGLRSWTLHEETGYRAITCRRAGPEALVCDVGAGRGLIGLDLDLSGRLQLTARLHVDGVTDPTRDNNRLVLAD